jgi:asparagine synthase (glutamine-hydrolysing)
MAHGLEIRTPLADIELLRALAPCLPLLRPGHGKAALAAAPATSLPADVASRAKTGFSVPTGAWMADAAAGRDRAPRLKGLASRQWARKVYAAAIPAPSLATAA